MQAGVWGRCPTALELFQLILLAELRLALGRWVGGWAGRSVIEEAPGDPRRRSRATGAMEMAIGAPPDHIPVVRALSPPSLPAQPPSPAAPATCHLDPLYPFGGLQASGREGVEGRGEGWAPNTPPTFARVLRASALEGGWRRFVGGVAIPALRRAKPRDPIPPAPPVGWASHPHFLAEGGGEVGGFCDGFRFGFRTFSTAALHLPTH